MALFLFYGSSSSSTSRLNILALIILVLICYCSYCSSSSLISPIIDVDSSTEDIGMFNLNDEINYYSPSYHYINAPEEAILPSKKRFLNLLLKSAIIRPNHRHKPYNNKRYASQTFHAMRG